MIIQWQPGVTLEVVERQVILAAYEFYRRNKTQTSIALGIAVRTLDARLAKYAEDDETVKHQMAQRKADAHERNLRHRGLLPPVAPVRVGGTLPTPPGPNAQQGPDSSAAQPAPEPAPAAKRKGA